MVSYTDRIGSLLEALDEPAYLVGHSFGGAIVAQSCELYPSSVRAGIYVCAFLLRDGQSVWRHGFPPARRQPGGPLDSSNLIIREIEGVLDLNPAVIREGFYSGCAESTADEAILHWRPEPLAPLRTPLTLTRQRFGGVPRVYVRCTRDRIIPDAAQRRMCRITPCRNQLSIDTGHSPFLTDTRLLAQHLEEASATVDQDDNSRAGVPNGPPD